jgi:hypothetical protein
VENSVNVSLSVAVVKIMNFVATTVLRKLDFVALLKG